MCVCWVLGEARQGFWMMVGVGRQVYCRLRQAKG